jgi:hypothetical protein
MRLFGKPSGHAMRPADSVCIDIRRITLTAFAVPLTGQHVRMVEAS